jgi:hypothetical protein
MPAKKKLPKAKTQVKSKDIEKLGKPRQLKTPKYKSFRFSKSIKHPTKLPNSWKIAKRALLLLWAHKRFFAVLILVYGVFNIVFVRGLGTTNDVGSVKSTFDQIFTGHLGHLFSGLAVFSLLITSSGNTSSATAGTYQTLLVLIVSLAVVWSLRQFMVKGKIRVRDSFYFGMYPLIPVLLILLVIGIQLLPLLIGANLYSTVTSNGIAVYAAEKAGWIIIYAGLALWSVYMITSSVFALYIVTLPNMTPMKALKSARELVRFRRWSVMRRVIFLPVILLICSAIIMLPIIIFITPLAEWVFFLLTMIGIVAVHAYMYTLYRELLA